MQATLAQVEQVRRESMAISRGLKRRDSGLVERLIEQYQHRLLRYLVFLTGHRETAEDLFQETWMRVLERGPQYDGRARFETWLFTIARNLVIDLSRKRKMTSLDALREPSDSAAPFEPASDDISPFQHCESQQEASRIAAALLRIDPVQREALVLRFHEDMSLEEISRVTRAPLSTVKSRLYRGLAALRPHIVEVAP
ncbi:MAG TPA: RNA polymerase sigma factor [Acidobacteriaceae bacterium]|nr:RNA polymerase sigma factor [Acidobacteriaceae bacterium]